MSTLTAIAYEIAERGKMQGWKPGRKKTDELNLEAWVGVLVTLQTLNHPELGLIQPYVAFALAPRGYSETLKLAEKHKAELEASKETGAA